MITRVPTAKSNGCFPIVGNVYHPTWGVQYWGVLGPDFRTVGPKRRPGAQNGARPQPGLCQAGRNVGYKSACQVQSLRIYMCPAYKVPCFITEHNSIAPVRGPPHLMALEMMIHS